MRPDDLLDHTGWIRNLARSLVADAATADDVVQETWLAALRHRPRSDRPLRPWLARVLRRQIALWQRRQRRTVVDLEREPVESLSAGDLVARAETQRRLAEHVLALDEPYRSAILLRYFEGSSASEIARRRGLPPATVRSWIRRGLRRIEAALDDEHGGDRPLWMGALAPLARPGPEAARIPGGRSLGRASVWIAGSLAVGVGWTVFGLAATDGEAPGVAPVQAAGRDDPSPRHALARSPALSAVRRVAGSPRPDARSAGDVTHRGLLVDPAGRPLGEFAFALRAPGGAWRPSRTDADGRFTFTTDAPGTPHALAAIDDPGRWERLVGVRVHGGPLDLDVPRVSIQPGESSEHLRVSVPSGPRFELDLELPRGLALADLRAHLRSLRPDSFSTRSWRLHVASVRGRPGSAWVRFAPLEHEFLGTRGPWQLQIDSADGLWRGTAEVASLERPESIRIELGPRARLAGVLEDAHGVPIEGEAVLLLGPDGERTMAATADDGAFRFGWLPGGEYVVRTRSLAFAPLERSFVLTPGVATSTRLVVERNATAGTVAGTLRSRTGTYEATVVVTLAPLADPARVQFALATWRTRGDARVGSFRFEDVPTGAFRLGVVAPGDGLAWEPAERIVRPPVGTLTVECIDDVPTTDRSVRVVDAGSGEAIARYQLHYSVDGRDEIRTSVEGTQVAIGSHGRIWTRRSGPVGIRDVPLEAAVDWRIEAEGYATARGDERLWDGVEGTPTVSLRPR